MTKEAVAESAESGVRRVEVEPKDAWSVYARVQRLLAPLSPAWRAKIVRNLADWHDVELKQSSLPGMNLGMSNEELAS